MKKFLTVFLATLLLVTIFAGCSTSGPSKSQMEQDAINYIEDEFVHRDDITITKLENEFSDCKDDIYEAQIIVYYDYTITYSRYDIRSFSDDVTLYVEYKHYSQGGWKLMDIDIVD